MENIKLESLGSSPERFAEFPLPDLAYLLLDYLKRHAPRNANLLNLCAQDGSIGVAATYGVASREFDNAIRSAQFKERLAALRNMVALPLAEAWGFLESGGFIAQEPFQASRFSFVTRTGLAIESWEDFNAAIGKGHEAGGKKKGLRK